MDKKEQYDLFNNFYDIFSSMDFDERGDFISSLDTIEKRVFFNKINNYLISKEFKKALSEKRW